MMMPGIPLDWLINWDVRTSPYLYEPYERERFSGGVNLSAQARNREIDSKIHVNHRDQILIVSKRMLEHLKGLNVT